MRSSSIVSIVAVAAVIGLGCAGLMLAPMIQESYERPDPAKMRAYRMSLFTDEQLLQMKARSIKESEDQKRQTDEADKASAAKRTQETRDCEANPAAKLRDPDHCFKPLPLVSSSGLDLVQSPDAIFEEHVMGICAMVESVREARQHRCLPPRS